MKTGKVFKIVLWAVIALLVLWGAHAAVNFFGQMSMLKKIIQRLSADSRIAEIIVTKSELDEKTGGINTTIKFLEYDVQGKPVTPKYFTFQGNLIQFQSLVVRFEDKLVFGGDKLRGKSAYLFLKAFVLDGANTQQFKITEVQTVPEGYKVEGGNPAFEMKIWQKFWNYALNPEDRKKMGIKNAQIEAPGSLFLPGTIYTIKIENDGGMRIDTRPVPEILKGEKIESK